MNRINKGVVFRSLHKEGKSLTEIGYLYGISQTAVSKVIRDLERHEKRYAESEVYKELYDKGEIIFGWSHCNGLVISTANALHRNGMKTVKDIKDNKGRIFAGRIRGIGKQSQYLINATFFNYEVAM